MVTPLEPPSAPDLEAPPTPTPTRSGRTGAVLAALAAALASAALVFWISRPETPRMPAQHPVTSAVPATPKEYAPAQVDAGQVSRAYDQLQKTYADEGLDGVFAFARACAKAVPTDPASLDFCVAFDHYAAALGGGDPLMQAWQANAVPRQLGLARAVLPAGVDPAQRLAELQNVARQLSLAVTDPAPPAASAKPASKAAPAAARNARLVADCRRRAPPARRTVCASPELRAADMRLRAAYDRALSRGADPHRLAEAQRRWRGRVEAAGARRAAVARLYRLRIAELQRARRAPSV